MQHYFFDHNENAARSPDEEGIDLPNIEAAKAEALKLWPNLHTKRRRGIGASLRSKFGTNANLFYTVG